MADRCSGCTSKFKFREKPTDCPKCRRVFCNMCLNPKKVKCEGATCVYCSAKQRQLNEAEDKDILKNFHDRYYKHKNQGPPIVSKLHNDPRITNASSAQSGGASYRPLIPDKEVEALERRYRRLKEDGIQKSVSVPDESAIQKRLDDLRDKPKDPVSEGQLHDRLSKLQGQPTNTSAQPTANEVGGVDPTRQKTETEQTNDLLHQFKEEVAIDNKVSGVEPTCTTSGDDVPAHLTTTSDGNPSKDEDPYKVLHDLHRLQAEQERDALKDVQAPDIQAMLQQTRAQTTADSENPDITYPSIEAVSSSGDTTQQSSEVLQLIGQAAAENKLEEEERARDEDFIKMTSKRLAHIKDEPDSDEEVKSKPKGKHSMEQGDDLEFTWHHFDKPTGATGGTVGGAIAQVMGNQWSFDDDESFEHEVHQLIQQMAEENALDEKLEKQGISLEEPQKPNSPKPEAAAINPYSYSAFGQEQLPWCCICNNDAEIRCHDCNGDLYCVPCFSRGHEEYGWFDHKYIAYEPPRKS